MLSKVIYGIILLFGFGEASRYFFTKSQEKKNIAYYKTLLDELDEGFCIIEVLFDKQGKPYDYKFIETNASFEKQTGLTNAKGKNILSLAPKIEKYWFTLYGQIALTGKSLRFQNKAEQLKRIYDVYAFRIGNPSDRHVAVFFKDITQQKKAEEERLASEEKFTTAFRSSPYPTAITTLEDGKLIDVNDRFIELFGYTREEILGNTTSGLNLYVKPEERTIIINLFKEKEGLQDYEVTFKTKKGEARDGLLSSDILKTSKGRLILTTFQDITGLKKTLSALKESEGKLLEAQRLARMGSYLIDVRTGEAELSDLIFDILQKPKTGKIFIDELFELIHPEDKEKIIAVYREGIVSGSENREYEFRIITPGGVKYLSASRKTFFSSDGVPEKIFGTLIDITERKLVQLKLEQTLKELQRSNKDLEQFAYTASHDLQEPIRMIKSYAQLLKYKYQDKLDESACSFLDFVNEGASRMEMLVNDLLAYSRISVRKHIIEDVDCNEIIRNIISDFKIKILEENVKINYGSLPVIKANKTQIRQLFQNFIQNAIKFRSTRDPEITITSERTDSKWHFIIADNGIGIEEEYYNKIFTIFQRLHDREKYPGTGIGLAICKKIIERHGGSVYVESRPGEGSEFHFTISVYPEV